jgi:general secretion pathway protein G
VVFEPDKAHTQPTWNKERTMKTAKQTLRKPTRGGFTLLELLIVMAIIVAIAAMVAPNLLSSQQEADINRAKADIKLIENNFKMMATKNGGYYPIDQIDGPQSIRALAEEWSIEGRDGVYPPLFEDIPQDPWGNEYDVQANGTGQKPRIWSYGPDKQDGTQDDISNDRRSTKS